MTHQEAINLIGNLNINQTPQTWLDLGCGSGTFTLALASLLPKDSKVIGIDNQFQKLPTVENITIEFQQANMNNLPQFSFPIHGVLMANSLHYIQHQQSFLKELADLMDDFPQFIIIEYDTNNANPYVPFPIRFNNLKTLFDNTISIKKIGERRSLYHGKMYAAQICKK